MKVEVKTNIAEWGQSGEKEKIVFANLDFAPDQVADIDRIIRKNGDNNTIRLTIEPVQKRLGIKPIVSRVKLVSMSCRAAGQRIKISEFKSPDERAESLKRLVNTDTQVLLTMEDEQGDLFGDKATEGTEDTEKITQPSVEDETQSSSDESQTTSNEYIVGENNIIENPTLIHIKFPKAFGIFCDISYGCINGLYYTGHDISARHTGDHVWPELKTDDGCTILEDAIKLEVSRVNAWINNLPKYKYAEKACAIVDKAWQDYLAGL
jgi:hypothetical protein